MFFHVSAEDSSLHSMADIFSASMQATLISLTITSLITADGLPLPPPSNESTNRCSISTFNYWLLGMKLLSRDSPNRRNIPGQEWLLSERSLGIDKPL